MKPRLPAVVLALILFLVPSLIQAQNPPTPGQQQRPGGAIMGMVRADSAGPALAGAAITIRTAGDSALVTGGITDNAGRFRLEGLPPGNYRVHVSYLGYKSVNLTASITPAASANLGTISLKTDVIALEGVTAETQRSAVTVQVDRTVYNTKEMPAASGGNTTDLLRNIPELDVDIDGNVKLQGSQSVAVHLNGRPAPLRGEALKNFLQSMPANRIDKVEIIPNPSAKYDPEGIAGILNIVTKENLDLGLSGSLSLNADARGRHGTSANLAYQKGRLTLFGNVSLNLNKNVQDLTDLRQNLLVTPNTFFRNKVDSDMTGSFTWFDGSIEYKLTNLTTAWLSGRGNLSSNGMEGIGQYAILDELQHPTYRYNNENDTEFDFKHNYASLGLRRVVKAQSNEQSLELRRNGSGMGSENEYIRHFLTPDGQPMGAEDELGLTKSENDVAEYVLQADVTRQLTPNLKLEAGYKGATKGTDYENVLERFLGDRTGEPIRSERSDYTYDEDYHQLYTTVSRQFGKFGIQLGARGEIATTNFALPTGDSFDNEYESLFPSINLSFIPAQGWTSRFAYSKRVDRPQPDMLNPGVPSADSLNRFVGNPELMPKYTHSYTFDITKMGAWGMFKFAPYYRLTLNNWDYFKIVDDRGVATLTWRNTDEVKAYGATTTLSLRSGSTANGFINLNMYQYERDASNISAAYSGDGFRWDVSVNGMMQLRPGVNAQMFVRYQAPQDMPQGRIGAHIFSSVGLRHQFMDKKATLSVNVMDPFALMKFSFETRDATHIQTSENHVRFRSVRVGLSYTFGKPPQSVVRRPQEEQPATQQTPEIR
ncbi:MAG TPA: TonB-dependent receptor [Longimicrobiales bacterium]|nr:TonB-dependent receptor [Longimicrobiales bacterium]